MLISRSTPGTAEYSQPSLFTDYVKALNVEADDAFGDSVALIRDTLAVAMIMRSQLRHRDGKQPAENKRPGAGCISV